MSGNRSTYLLSGAPYPQNNYITFSHLLPPERVGVYHTSPTANSQSVYAGTTALFHFPMGFRSVIT